jgi:adenylate cyclase
VRLWKTQKPATAGASRRFKRFGLGRVIGLLLLIDFLLLRLWDPAPVEALRDRTFDLYQVLQPREAYGDPTVIVDIDETSLKKFGQWPWPRTIVADLVVRLSQYGAAVIGFDVLFAEPDRTSPTVAAETIRGLDPATREALRRLPNNDELLAQAISQAKVVVGQSGFRTIEVSEESGPPVQTGLAVIGEDPTPFLVTFPHLLRNLAVLERAAAGRGLFSIRQEPDGVVRRVPLLAQADGIAIPSLTLDMMRVARGADAIVVNSDATGVLAVGVPGLSIPTDSRGRAWIHFAPHDPDRFISAADILDGRVNPDRFRGKLVVVGTSAVGLLDLKTTPIDGAIPGVELQAQILDSISGGMLLNRPIWATGIEFVAACFLSLVLLVLAPSTRAVMLLVLGGLIAAATIALSWLSFSRLGLLVDVTFPLATSLSIYLILVFTNYIRAAADKQTIRSAFSQYISPALVDELARSPEKLALGGDRRDMTVMFSDVRGFTAFSEAYKDDPQGLTALLNRLLTPLTNAVLKHKGTIDKYIGDGIMAFWNAPLPDDSHELNACAAALDMLERLSVLNEERARESLANAQSATPLRIGIGLNTGPCFVGNFGSDLQFNYSVLGDTVNVSSRLESQCKTYGVPIVIGPRTAEAVRARYGVLELDTVQVVGKTEPQRIFTLITRRNSVSSPDFARLSRLNELMLAAYRQGDWERALDLILEGRELARMFGVDSYHSIMVGRIRSLVETAPPAGWQGVTIVVEK